MKRRGITGILATVMAITCFLFDGQAAELTPTKLQRAIQPPIQTQPSTPQPTLLPDLVVEKVWLDGRNHIVLTLKNTGKGSVSDDFYVKGCVRVTYGVSQKDYAIKMVDPGKTLARSGGVVTYTTNIELREPTRVMVEVDSTRQIPESREDNNLLSASLTPKLAISQEPKVAKPPLSGETLSYQERKTQVGVVQDKMKYDLRDKDTQMTPHGPLKLRSQIIVYSPHANDQIFRQCDWVIRWRRVGEMNNRVRIKILEESGELLGTIPEVRINNRGDNSYTCKVWTRSTKGKVKVKIETIDGAIWGESGVFEFISPTIEVLHPEQNQIYYPGGKIPIKWHIKGKLSEDKVDIELLKPDNTHEKIIRGITSKSTCESSGWTDYYKLDIPENIKPGAYRISVRDSLYQAGGKNSGLFQISSGVETKKPDFVWVQPDLKDRIHGRYGKKLGMILKNIGGKFVGSIDVRIQAMEANIEKTETLVFTEQNPFDRYETQLIFIGPFDWPHPKICSLRFLCDVDPNQKISELNENNNKLIVETYTHWVQPHFFILDDRITLTSGKNMWDFKGTINPLRLDSIEGMSLGLNSVSMDVSFYGVNCSSGETYSHNPRIAYFGPNCQLKEEDIGPVRMMPGETRPFNKTIQIGLCKGSFIKVKTPIVTYEVRIEFTDRFLVDARPRPHPFPDRIYKPSNVQLGFARGTKTLPNGGSVTLEKGDWRLSYRDEFAMDFNVRVRLKANATYRTKITFKMLSFGSEFMKSREIEFEPEKEVDLLETIKMWQSPRESVLKIIDETGSKEIFNGSIYCSDSLLKELGWRPWLHISQNPNIYLNNQKKEVTIKCYVFNSGGPANNQRWGLDLEIKYHNQVVQSKTWQFDGAAPSKLIEKTFTFRPRYDGEHIYKMTLTANNKNILTNRQDGLQKVGSFDVPSNW